MPLSKYKGYSLRNRVFWGFIVVCILSMAGSSILSYFLLKNNAKEQSRTDMQNKTNSLMAALDYAVSQKPVSTEQLPEVLKDKILEKQDMELKSTAIYSYMHDMLGPELLQDLDEELKRN